MHHMHADAGVDGMSAGAAAASQPLLFDGSGGVGGVGGGLTKPESEAGATAWLMHTAAMAHGHHLRGLLQRNVRDSRIPGKYSSRASVAA